MSKIFKISIVSILLLIPLAAFAAQFQNPLGVGMVGSAGIKVIIGNIIAFLLGFVAIAALASIVYGGLRLILGGAISEQEVARAKQIIFWAIIGLLVVGLAAAILNALGFILGLRAISSRSMAEDFLNGFNHAVTVATGSGMKVISFDQFFLKIITLLLDFVAAASMAAVLVGAIMYVISLGDEAKVARAKRIILFALLGLVIAGVYWIGLAAVCEVTGVDAAACQDLPNTAGGGLTDLFINIQNIILYFIAAASLAAIVWGAIMYVTSLGDESKNAAAKRVILYAIVGLLIAGLLGAILSATCYLFGGDKGACADQTGPAVIISTTVNIVSLLLSIISVLAFGAIVYGAYLYVTSQGDEQRVATAKRVILYAGLGLFIAVISAIIVNVFISIIG